MDEALLEGHLGVTKELVSFLGPDKKYEVGADPNNSKGNLIKVISLVYTMWFYYFYMYHLIYIEHIH